MIRKGIIVSIQQYGRETTEELAAEAANAGAVAIRTDKMFSCRLPLIGLKKEKVKYRENEPYITHTLEAVKAVEAWTKIIAVDYRKINPNIKEISDYAKNRELTIIADIGDLEDYFNIVENDYYHAFITTAMTVFKKAHYPDLDFMRVLTEYDCRNIIAEGNIQTRQQVERCYKMGIDRVCIGGAISDIYKLTKKFTSVKMTKE